MLTVKSDDVAGRSKIYESIVKERISRAGIPESFKFWLKNFRRSADVTLVEKN